MSLYPLQVHPDQQNMSLYPLQVHAQSLDGQFVKGNYSVPESYLFAPQFVKSGVNGHFHKRYKTNVKNNWT